MLQHGKLYEFIGLGAVTPSFAYGHLRDVFPRENRNLMPGEVVVWLSYVELNDTVTVLLSDGVVWESFGIARPEGCFIPVGEAS